MKFRVEYAPRSVRDLAKIQTYIEQESGSRMVADRFIARVLNACDALNTFPERFPPYPFARLWRMMPFENYLVFFRIEESAVRVGHVRHSARRPFSG